MVRLAALWIFVFFSVGTAHGTELILTFDDGPISKDWWTKKIKECPSSSEYLSDLKRILIALEKQKMKAVFYVTGWGATERSKDCEARTEEGYRKAFQEGLKLIAKSDQWIGLHAFDHFKYKNPFLSQKEMREDLQKLISEIEKADFQFERIWRPPYGSQAFGRDELVKKMKLSWRKWKIDSMDWVYHDDAFPLFKMNSGPKAWKAQVRRSIRDGLKKYQKSKRAWVDLMFHVNERTSQEIGLFLEDIRKGQGALTMTEGGKGSATQSYLAR